MSTAMAPVIRPGTCPGCGKAAHAGTCRPAIGWWKYGTCRCGARVLTATATGIRPQCTPCRDAQILAQADADFEPPVSPLWPSLART